MGRYLERLQKKIKHGVGMSSLDLDPALIAHARTVPEMPTPALTCHLGFRLPAPKDHKKDKAALVERINAFLDHVDGRLDVRKIRFTVDETDPGRSGMELRRTDESLSVRLKIIGCFEVSLSVEIEAEYVTYSFRAYPVKIACEPSGSGPEKEMQQAFEALEVLLREDFKDDQKSNAAIAAIYESAWSAIFRELRIEALLANNGPRFLQESRSSPDQPVGSLFCEFRGLVLRTRCIDRSLEIGKQGGANEAAGVEDAATRRSRLLAALNRTMKEEVETLDVLRRPADKYQVETEFIPGKQAHLDHVPPAVVAYLNARPNFFSRLIGFRRADALQPNYAGNAVLCHLYDGFSVYGSTLGAESGSGHRLRYFVVYGGPSRHQLARLLHRLHSAGEARLAALFDYAQMREASRRIRALDQEIDAMDKDHPRRGSTVATDLFEKVSKELRILSGEFPGGLTYRVSRSAYYDSLLNQRVRDLNVTSIPGWQTYPGFIRRNLWQHYRSIQNIGARYFSIQERLRLINASATAEAGRNQIDKLVTLQRTADLIGLGAFTYYGGNVIALGIKVGNEHMSTADKAWFCGQKMLPTGLLCSDDSKVLELSAYAVAYVVAFFLGWMLRELIKHGRG